MTPFGQQLQFLRSDRGYSQKSLAAATGLPHRTLSAVETGRRSVLRPDELDCVAKVLQLDNEELAELREAEQLSSYHVSLPRDLPPATLRAVNELIREMRFLDHEDVRQIRNIVRRAALRREQEAGSREGPEPLGGRV